MDIKVRLNEANIRLLERVSDITNTESGVDQDGWIDVDYILSALDDITDMYEDTEDRFQDYVRNVDENYIEKKHGSWEYGE